MTNKTKGTTLSNGVFRLPMITRILSNDKHFFLPVFTLSN